MFIRRSCLCLLVMICMVLSGCFSATGNLTINEDGSVKYEASMASVDLLKNVIEEQKNSIVERNSSAKVEPYIDGNLSGYRITANYPSVSEYARSLSGQKGGTSGLTVKGIREVKGWFYDAYFFDFLMEGNKDIKNDPDAQAMAKAMASQMKCEFTVNLPYPADFTNADQVANEKKTLSWNLSSMLTSEEDKSVQVQFKVWHKAKVIISLALIGVILLVALIMGILAATANNPGDRSSRGIIAGIALLLAIALGAMSGYMLLKEPKFPDSTIISQTTSAKSTTDNNTPAKGTETKPASPATPATKPATPTASHNTGEITGTEVRMRANPGSNANIIGFFDKGEKVEILDVKPEWVQVKRANGAVGWVSDKFCKY